MDTVLERPAELQQNVDTPEGKKNYDEILANYLNQKSGNVDRKQTKNKFT